MWLFLLLVGVPILEIALFIEVGGWLGLWPTLAIVVATALAGAVMLRAQGIAALADLQHRLEAGRDPRATLAHGALILVSGVLLLTPGFFTDAVGLALLLAPVRAVLLRVIGRRIHVAAERRRAAQEAQTPPARQTVEAEYEDVTPPPGR